MPDRWNNIAAVRKRQIEGGADLTFSKLFLPYYTELAMTTRPRSLLEVGCGTGHLSLALCKHVATTVALEPSKGMCAVARDTLRRAPVQLTASTIEDFTADAPFDLVISHLCGQVVERLAGFLAAIVRHMHRDSRLVLSLPHPCFYNGYKHFIDSSEYAYMKETRKTVSFTVTKDPQTRISGIPYHHRPISAYFSEMERQGLCVFDFHELYPSPELEREYGEKWGVPRYCVFHCGTYRRQSEDANNRLQHYAGSAALHRRG
jgi:SAM-dependent methyltransferase